MAVYFWTRWGTPGWTFLSPIYWVGGHKPDVYKNLGQPEFCPEGNPINQATGNKFQLESDYKSPVPGGLVMQRYYNSLAPTHGSLGTHWSSIYDRRLETQHHESTLRLVRPDGKRHVFWQAAAGGWQGEPDVAHRIEALEDTQGTLSGWTVKDADDNLEVYNLQGRLLSITDRTGSTQTLHYDIQHRLAAVTGPFGRELRFAYDDRHRLIWMTDPAGDHYQYDYDSQGRLVSVHYPDATTRYYLYADPANEHALTGIIDETGARFARWAYDGEGRAIMSEHAGGTERITLSYTAKDTTTVTDALGASRTYTFATHHGVIKPMRIAGDACGHCSDSAQSYHYDANGRLESQSNRNDHLTRYVYNARGLQTSRTEAAGTPQERIITTKWHPDYRLSTEINEPGKRTEFSYDANTRLHIRTERDTITEATRTWTYTYTAEGLLDSVDGPRSDVSDITNYEYDTQGNLIRITNALGQVTEITDHDAHGRPLRLVDANGVSTTLDYDARGRLRARILGISTETVRTEFEYNEAGKLKRLTQANGATMDYSYDAAQRQVESTDGLGNRIAYTLDARGNRLSEAVYEAGGTLRRSRTWVYDRLGRMIQALDAMGQGSDYAYDASGNQISVTDALGRVTTRGYDALDRLMRETDPLGGVTRYEYDALDRLIAVTDPRGLRTTYNYNAFSDLLERHSPDTGLTSATYDAAGNRLSQTDARGILTRYRYDALNRLTGVRYPNSSLNVSFTYDQGQYGIGRLTAMHDASGTTTYTYDASGNLIRQTATVLGVNYVTQYRYDAANQLIQIIYPSGLVVDYQRDRAGSISRVSATFGGYSRTLASDIGYLPFGAMSGLSYGHGLTVADHYDLDYRLTEHFDGAGRALRYQYDAVGNLTGILDLLDNARDRHFDYDTLDRLTHEQDSDSEREYSYDSVGNRTQRIRHDLELKHNTQPVIRTRTQHYTYAEQANQLIQISQKPLEYDANGNLTANSKASKTFSYNDANRLASFSKNTTLKAHYIYNGRGERVIRHKHTAKGSITLHYHYNQNGQLLGVSRFNQKGKLKTHKEFVWIAQRPLAQITTRYTHNGGVKSQETIYLHSNHLNTPRLATDERQRLVWRWSSDAFGQGAPDTDPDGDAKKTFVPLRFPGQIASEGGVYYNYFRDYDPRMGRYIQSDPIGLRGGMNTYAYVESNPLKAVDPLGLFGYRGTIDPSFKPESNGPSRYESCPDRECDMSFLECRRKCISYWNPVDGLFDLSLASGAAGALGGASTIGHFGRVGGGIGLFFQGWTYLFCTTSCSRYPCAMEK